MDNQASDLTEKIRRQFDTSPYPKIPLDSYPRSANYLYLHNIVTGYYRRDKKIVQAEGKLILDAGCGSGYTSLALAVANPGAKIVGIDLSEESAKLAKERLKYHGFSNTDFYGISIYDLSNLTLEFDYIHCHETLYLLPDVVAGLKALKSVLKPHGIIRTNLHSSLQRTYYYQSQKIFKMMGLMDESPTNLEIELVRETMKALKDSVFLKLKAWKPEFEKDEQRILANQLLQGDKGYTVPEMFSALEAADLEFVSMVNWSQWDLMDLFQEPDNLPVFLGISLPELSPLERLHLFELLHPVHRLLDFWCAHPNSAHPWVPPSQWTDSDWQQAQVYLHPQLRSPALREQIVASTKNMKLLTIGKYLPFAKDPGLMVGTTVVECCLIPLLEGSQSMPALVERWLRVKPVDPVTLELTDAAVAFETVKQMLLNLEQMGCVLLERLSGEV